MNLDKDELKIIKKALFYFSKQADYDDEIKAIELFNKIEHLDKNCIELLETKKNEV